MRCRHYRRLIVLCKDAELTPEQQAWCQRHRESCPTCRDFCRDMRCVESLLNLIAAAPVPPEFSGIVMQRVRQTSPDSRRAGFLLARWPWPRSSHPTDEAPANGDHSGLRH